VSITVSSSKTDELEKQIKELKQANEDLLAKNTHLEQENKRLALKIEVDNLVDGVIA
jgi:cell division protein FtsB